MIQLLLSLAELFKEVSKKAKIRNPYNQVYDTWPRAPHGKVTKHKENTTHKRAKRPALSQHVITRLQWTDKTAWSTRNINNKNDPQKKHSLGTISKTLWSCHLLIEYPQHIFILKNKKYNFQLCTLFYRTDQLAVGPIVKILMFDTC